MSRPRISNVRAGGRWWSGDELEAMACAWRAAMLERIGDENRNIAAAIPATPAGVALFAALTSLHVPAIMLDPDGRVWHSDPPLPHGTVLVLPPSLAHLASEAHRIGCVPYVLPDTDGRRAGPSLTLLQTPGVVVFTSGSTGSPKPVFRTMKALQGAAAARLRALGLTAGDGIVAGVSLAHGPGLSSLISSLLLEGPLALLDPIDHRAALATLALPEFKYWRATPHFVGVLGRCTLTGPARVPEICLLSSPVSQAVFDAFSNRFGVPLRQTYSSTETGCIAVDAAPPVAVQPNTVGPPLPRVEIHIGDHPNVPSPSGEIGRIWVRSPWQMTGYGFPPSVARPGDVDGWWPTRDLGVFRKDGRLVLAGRLDTCIRTRDGRLVNLAAAANGLRELPGVRRVVVVPLDGPSGATFGAVFECEPSITLASLRRRLSDSLPSWSWPRKVTLVPALPVLPNGKPDRRACLAALGDSPVR